MKNNKYSRRVNYVNPQGLEFKLDNVTIGDKVYSQPTEAELRADMWKWFREMQAAQPPHPGPGTQMLPVEKIELHHEIIMVEHEK